MNAEDGLIAKPAYDELADTYAADVKTNAYDAEVELLPTTSLIPNRDGKRVLDADCGTGFTSLAPCGRRLHLEYRMMV